MAAVGQLAGGSSSAVDLAVGHFLQLEARIT